MITFIIITNREQLGRNLPVFYLALMEKGCSGVGNFSESISFSISGKTLTSCDGQIRDIDFEIIDCFK